jgi:tripartite-type tricarboxylate transporter receptor subunit TctC
MLKSVSGTVACAVQRQRSLTALIGGQVRLAVDVVASTPFIKSGKIKAISCAVAHTLKPAGRAHGGREWLPGV